jgi:hypothetical protein
MMVPFMVIAEMAWPEITMLVATAMEVMIRPRRRSWNRGRGEDSGNKKSSIFFHF